MTKIYTKTGDAGETAIFGGTKLSKDDPQVEAYGSIDELTTSLGMILSYFLDDDDAELLTNIQRDLHILMSLLCSAKVDLKDAEKRIKDMETYIDEVEKAKPTPNKFILIQGTRLAVVCHQARVVCRRAERRMVSFLKSETHVTKDQSAVMIQYLNRLSDMLYAMGRMYNMEKEQLV